MDSEVCLVIEYRTPPKAKVIVTVFFVANSSRVLSMTLFTLFVISSAEKERNTRE